MIIDVFIETKTKSQKKFVLNYLKQEREKQVNLTEEEIAYSIISPYTALKYKILNLDFIFHPLVIQYKKFYEDTVSIKSINEVFDLTTKVLEYEFMNEANFIGTKSIKKLASFHKKLKNKLDNTKS